MTRKFPARFALAVALTVWAYQTYAQTVEVRFSPNGGAAAAITHRIDAAKKTVHVLAYAISEPQITAALINAAKRGVDVQIVLDRHEPNQPGSTSRRIHEAGITTTVDRAHALMHDKTAVIDNTITITGSMNWTKSGESKNAENIIIIDDPTIAAQYEAHFRLHASHAVPFRTKRNTITRAETPSPPASTTPNPAHKKEP